MLLYDKIASDILLQQTTIATQEIISSSGGSGNFERGFSFDKLELMLFARLIVTN